MSMMYDPNDPQGGPQMPQGGPQMPNAPGNAPGGPNASQGFLGGLQSAAMGLGGQALNAGKQALFGTPNMQMGVGQNPDVPSPSGPNQGGLLNNLSKGLQGNPMLAPAFKFGRQLASYF